MIISGCGLFTDLQQKSLATEQEVIGLHLVAPNIIPVGDGSPSMVTLDFGYIDSKYMSAPPGGSASIRNDYSDVSLFKTSGNFNTHMDVKNSVDTTK